mgnify:FL=1
MNRARVLVDTAWVDQHRDDIVLIDVDEDTTAYDVGHIDSALKLDWTRDLQDQVCRDLIDAPGFERLMSRLGVANDTTVVLYGGNNNWFAAYAYWLFKLYGHDNVRLLDGGRKRWEAEGRPLTTAVPASRTTTRYVAKPNPALRAMREEVLESAGTHNLVDVRTPDEYAGRLLAPAHLPHEQAQRAGHIPGAINVPWSRAVRDDGTFEEASRLRAIYSEAGLDWAQPTITYCRIGERSSLTWFVLNELLGHPTRNYDGSWTEYGSLIGVPVAVGDR